MTSRVLNDHKDFHDIPRRLVAMENHWPSHASTGWHSHPRGQLLYAIKGVMLVQSDAGAWVVPPNRALWMVAGLHHNVTMSGDVEMRTAYIEGEVIPDLSEQACVINVSPLLRELLVEAVRIPLDSEPSARDERIIGLLIDELKVSSTVALHLPIPADPRLKKICDALIEQPASQAGAADWAKAAGLGERTLHRLFSRETGMTFSQWREQARLLSALKDIAAGKKGIEVALNCGYSSQSAFSAMFRRHFGTAPSTFYR
ncbi:helix-turn-helix transcriptional regulator [Oceanimonas sp. MB9]|uniref:AraC family transcriptional regulator n=1 Tax=Oceanimonas sp. MB9 TaxID=2588453 RepID=UPI0013F67F7F|nr:helix-turn-helix transcriptional regulator [Oceanimonas sp. MB9]NHI00463.1 HTH-type transcriptional regulator NimR [Oceanimonas sp. MB9]